MKTHYSSTKINNRKQQINRNVILNRDENKMASIRFDCSAEIVLLDEV